MTDFGSFNEYGQLTHVAVRRPSEAFVSDAKIDAEWRDLNYHARPDLRNADAEHLSFRKRLEKIGSRIIELPAAVGLTLDSLYTRDSLIVTPKGIVKPRMGKPQRRAESEVNAATLERLGWPIAGEIEGDGKIEGGDLVWLDKKTLLVGIGYRTNADGARQLATICGAGTEIVRFDLPHYKGRSDVFHLMSVLSPIDHDLAVVHLPLMPVRLVEFLESRKIGFVEVPESEFSSMGCNVLAIAPRQVLLVGENPITQQRMQAKGVEVHVISADDISRKGEGGPTCLTRPLRRN